MTLPIKNEWITKLASLRRENDELRLNLFVGRLVWFTYGILAGLGIAAILYAVARG